MCHNMTAKHHKRVAIKQEINKKKKNEIKNNTNLLLLLCLLSE